MNSQIWFHHANLFSDRPDFCTVKKGRTKALFDVPLALTKDVLWTRTNSDQWIQTRVNVTLQQCNVYYRNLFPVELKQFTSLSFKNRENNQRFFSCGWPFAETAEFRVWEYRRYPQLFCWKFCAEFKGGIFKRVKQHDCVQSAKHITFASNNIMLPNKN